MNLGIKEHFENGKISETAHKIMSYNEENIKKIKERHPGFGSSKKHKSAQHKIEGIENWNKLGDRYRLKVRNYLPFMLDTSKCQRFKLQKLDKFNFIHVQNEQHE